ALSMKTFAGRHSTYKLASKWRFNTRSSGAPPEVQPRRHSPVQLPPLPAPWPFACRGNHYVRATIRRLNREVHVYKRSIVVSALALLLMVSGACSSKPGDSADASAAASAGDKSITIPAGTAVSIRLGNSLSSKTSKAGDHFTGTLAQPIEVAGQAAVPA